MSSKTAEAAEAIVTTEDQSTVVPKKPLFIMTRSGRWIGHFGDLRDAQICKKALLLERPDDDLDLFEYPLFREPSEETK
jgi:hypothetical protein